MSNKRIAPVLFALGAVYGCGGGENDLPTTPPTRVEKVADEGFQHAGAVAASPDGKEFYVAAYTMEGEAAVFSVDVDSGTLEALHAGAPLAYPSDLATACNGESLFVSDMGFAGQPLEADEERGDDGDDKLAAIYTLSTSGGQLTELPASGILSAAGIVVSTDCEKLYISGWAEDGEPAVFTLPTAGGSAKTLYKGAPLMSPTGIHVDAGNIAWVMDHAADGDDGEGTLFAITEDGEISEAASGLEMGRHGGVSLTPGGLTAVIPTQGEGGMSQLITADTKTGEQQVVETPDIENPTGTAAALSAPVMVVAGENSIHIATFE